MQEIRKISIGNGNPDSMIHYQVGKDYNLSGNIFVLVNIIQVKDISGKNIFDIYIQNDNGKVLWKTLVDIPALIEYNINFE